MRTSTETYEHTISGLLQKRREIMEEMAVTRERLGVLANDIEAIDRVLERLGHDGKLEMNPHVPRLVLFYRGQLRQWLLTELRELDLQRRGCWRNGLFKSSKRMQVTNA